MTTITNNTDVCYTTDFDVYANYEKLEGSSYNRRCINGRKTGCGNCVGYCQYKGHPGFLTDELRRVHNCINKQCFYYVPKPKREKKVSYIPTINIVDLVSSHMKEYQGVKVIRAERSPGGVLNCFYISITNAYYETDIEQSLCATLAQPIKLIRLNYDFEKCAELLLRA